VRSALLGLETPGRLIILGRNEGRARGRNRLARDARARHLLLLDADMAPAGGRFLRRYLELAEEDVAIVCGGFSLPPRTRGPLALHHALQQRGEALAARIRARQPEKYVFTSNLLVRRDVLLLEPFDETFLGWGWEDVEWGLRVAARFPVLQIDNPAAHLGLDTAETLASKYEQSQANFARVNERHPDALSRFPSHRLARLLRRSPLRGILRAVLKKTALHPRVPLTARVAAMKLYRAALYAEVV
jgi:hypothetical protein